jgi:hypothetical protein
MVSMVDMSDFEQHKEEWRAAEQWLEDSKEWTAGVKSPDGKFLLGVFTVGPSGNMVLVYEVLMWWDTNIIKSLKKYCEKKDLSYYGHRWFYASPDVKDFPQEQDTPQSLGWPSNGSDVISFVLGTDFRERVFNHSKPRPVTHGKMPRGRKKIDMSYLPFAHAPVAVAAASCPVPVHLWVPPKRF